jgi:hypothetical protein
MRGSLHARLRNLERQRWANPRVYTGAFEVHCVGGLGHLEGAVCNEHEGCVFDSKPVMNDLRRLIVLDWHEGMESPFRLD